MPIIRICETVQKAKGRDSPQEILLSHLGQSTLGIAGGLSRPQEHWMWAQGAHRARPNAPRSAGSDKGTRC